jgi:hypothetical protein
LISSHLGVCGMCLACGGYIDLLTDIERKRLRDEMEQATKKVAKRRLNARRSAVSSKY